jgi:effector-binding domain-containing protein
MKKQKKEGNMSRKIGIVVGLVIVVFLSVSLYFGIFNPVIIGTGVKGPYKVACLDHIGPYKNICNKICGTQKLLKQQNIPFASACGLYYDDPSKVPADKLRSKGGCLVDKDFKADIAEKIDIPKREVVFAIVKAHPCVAAMKVYPKLMKWLSENKMEICGPCLEIYNNDGTVETQMPIIQKKE